MVMVNKFEGFSSSKSPLFQVLTNMYVLRIDPSELINGLESHTVLIKSEYD